MLIFEMISELTPFQAPSPLELFVQILTVEVEFEQDFPSDAHTLVEMLLEKDPSKRASGEHIRNSAYFAGVNWDQVVQSRLQPHFRPRVKNPLDASHFDKYSEEALPIDEMKTTEAAVFASF